MDLRYNYGVYLGFEGQGIQRNMYTDTKGEIQWHLKGV